MKKIILLAGLFVAALFFSGCLTTLHPIFTEKDLIMNSRLLGSWKKTKDKAEVTYRHPNAIEIKALSPALQKHADKIYIFEEEDARGNATSRYYAFMVKLGKHYYMDYYPADTKDWPATEEFFAAHFIPMHSIYRIQFGSNNSFSMQQLDGGYLEKLIDNKQIRIDHEISEDGSVIITAPTKDLQQYLIKYGDVQEAYDNDNNETYSKIN